VTPPALSEPVRSPPSLEATGQCSGALHHASGTDPVVAVIWQRFGPYHLARLRGAADVLKPRGWRVIGLEIAEEDEYRWSPAAEALVSRHTLFPNQDYSTIPARYIRRRVVEALDRLQPSAVCINGWAVSEAVAALSWCRSNRRRGILMSETFEPSRNPLKTYVKQRRVRQFDAAFVGGRLHARYLASLGYPPDRIEIGYDVVDNHHFNRAVPTFTGRCRGVSEKRYVLANTRFLERKGIDALLRAYARYRALEAPRPRNDAPWHLVISGSGEMEQAWKLLAGELGVADTVHWPGFVQYEDLPAVYRSAGVFVHPARREPWGLVVNEAAAAGLPLIVGRRVGAACELVREEENGFLVDPDDIESLAGLLVRVSRMSNAERRSMGEASRRIAADFGPERFGRALERLLAGEA
jgi:glycosyltransferase involved in cell wall biosynthesis